MIDFVNKCPIASIGEFVLFESGLEISHTVRGFL